MREITLLPVAVLLAWSPTTAVAQWLDPARDPSVVSVLDAEDTQFSFWSGPGGQEEWLLSFGAVARSRVKGWQDVTALRFDLEFMRGRTVADAELHLAKADETPIFSLAAATINADWHEGTGWGGPALPGQPCWRWRSAPPSGSSAGPEHEWTFPQSDFGTASFGNYGSLVSFGFRPGQTLGTYSAGGRTWIRMKLDPQLIQAMVLDQYGLMVTDARGRNGNYNPRVFTREQGAGSQPKLLLKLSPVLDGSGPGPVANLMASPGADAGQVVLRFGAPADPQASRAFGYAIRFSQTEKFDSASPLARWRIPRPADPGTIQSVIIEDLETGRTYHFFVRAYDQAGNPGPLSHAALTVPSPVRLPDLANGGLEPPAAGGRTVASLDGRLRYWACSEVAQVNPVTGNQLADGYTGTTADDYKKANVVWDSATKTISITAARNEVVGVQVIIERLVASLHHIRVAVDDLVGPENARIPAASNIERFQLHYVRDGSSYYGDAAIPLAAPFPDSFPIPDPNHNPAGVNQSVWLDIYVPRNTAPGDYQGAVRITADELQGTASIALKVRVSPVLIPDYPTFLIDLNGYGNPWDFGNSQLTALRYFQTCHKHRMAPNTLPYGWSGNVLADRRPQLGGNASDLRAIDWSAFDAKYGRFFDGTAFSPLLAESPYIGPGQDTPTTTFYTPFFESWPMRVDDLTYGFDFAGLGGRFWDQRLETDPDYVWSNMPDVWGAFSPIYEANVSKVVQDWFTHAQEKGWTRTFFQSYLNHKWDYAGCAALWTLEECSVADDFRAVGYFQRLFREGRARAQAPDVRWHFRIDISTRWIQHFGQLDDRVNLAMINEESSDWHWRNLKYRNTQLRQPEAWFWYGGGHSPTQSSLGSARLLLKGWSQGLDGALPYWDSFQTNWVNAETLSVVYSGQNVPGFGRFDGAIAGVRMKTLRQAQQVIELLNLVANQPGWTRERLTQAVLSRYHGENLYRSYPAFSELDLFRLRADLMAQLESSAEVPWTREFILPQAAAGERIRTSMFLLNAAEEARDVTVELRNEQGEAFEVEWRENWPDSNTQVQTLNPLTDPVTLVSGAVRSFSTETRKETVAGAARLVSSGESVGVSGVFTILGQDGTFQSEAGIGASKPLLDSVIPAEASKNQNTGVALFNPHPESVEVVFILTDEQGVELGRTERSLPGHAHLARYVAGTDGLFPMIQTVRGTLRVTGTDTLAALALRQNLSRLNMTTLPVVAADSVGTEFFLPHFADGVFPGGIIQFTLVLFSLGTPANLSASFTGDAGKAIPVRLAGETASLHQFHLGQGEALFVETEGAGGLDGQLASGAVRVVSDSPVGVSGIFTIRGPQGQFLTETGIAASPLRSEATVVVENAGAASTGLAVFNPLPENVTLTLSLFDPQGQAPASGAGEGPSAEPGTRTLELPAGGRIAAFISELFPGLPMARGSMTIRGPAATLTLRQNLSPLSFTAMPVLGAARSGLPPAQ